MMSVSSPHRGSVTRPCRNKQYGSLRDRVTVGSAVQTISCNQIIPELLMGKQAHLFLPTTPEASTDTSNGASGTLRMMSPVRSVWWSVGTIFSISIVLVQETMNNVIATQCTKSSHSLTLSDVCWNFPDGSNLSIERAELPAFDGAKFTAASRCPYTFCHHLSLLYTLRVAQVVSIYTCECHESRNAEKGCHFAHQALQLPSQLLFADHN
jgi:hypothetical protein